jgi:diadenosine tetraphosphate (Ap4A) HIT family hydrolase
MQNPESGFPKFYRPEKSCPESGQVCAILFLLKNPVNPAHLVRIPDKKFGLCSFAGH